MDTKKKAYVLDTNILMQFPNSILSLQDNDVIITEMTIEELDKHKNTPGESGYNARQAVRHICRVGNNGVLPGGGILHIPLDMDMQSKGEHDGHMWNMESMDNRILNFVSKMQQEGTYHKVILITNDSIMRIKADMSGIEAQEYKKEQLISESVCSDVLTIEVMGDVIDSVYKGKSYAPEEFAGELYENRFILLRDICDPSHTALAKVKNGKIVLLEYASGKSFNLYGVTPQNMRQSFAAEALLAPADEIPLVILQGPAGTAKTFLSLAAGMQATFRQEKYYSMLISRNNLPFDNDIGYLPGDEQEKISPLLRCFMDNLEELCVKQGSSRAEATQLIDDYIYNGIIKLESLMYMRGRSIANTYIIIDEAQNASIGQIKGLLTRPGFGSKIVLCGDPDQIDNLKLDKHNNGLVYAAEKMRGSHLCAQVTFTDAECVRSPLAKEAALRLDATEQH